MLRYLSINRWNLLNGILSQVPRTSTLAQEDGFSILQEDGSLILLETD